MALVPTREHTVYSWEVKDETDNIFQSSRYDYLVKENCTEACEDFMGPLQDTFGCGEEEKSMQLTNDIKEKKKQTPSPKHLTQMVLRAITIKEYKERCDAKCYGCGANSPSQKDHMDGCLQDIMGENFSLVSYVEAYIKSTPSILSEKTQQMAKYYNIPNAEICMDTIDEVLREEWVPIQTMDKIPFQHESYPYEFFELYD